MGTWPDYVADDFKQLAGGFLCLSQKLTQMIRESHPDDDTSMLIRCRDQTLNWAEIFAPTGEPEGGYPKEGAKVIPLDAYLAYRKEMG